MTKLTFNDDLTPLEKAEFAARCFAVLSYRDCNAWSVAIQRTYGVRSLLKELKSDLAQTIAQEKAEEQIRETIYVKAENGFTQFTAEEAYVIAQALQSNMQRPE